jgi:hypothetical protein
MEGKPQFLLTVSVPAFTHSAAAQGGTIANATHGTGNNRVNVTSRVQSLARNGLLNFQVTNEILCAGDPAPGRVKELLIQVRQWNGQTHDYRFIEKSQVNPQIGSGGITPPIPGAGEIPFWA